MTASVTPSGPTGPAGPQPDGASPAQHPGGDQLHAGAYPSPYQYLPQGAQVPPGGQPQGGVYPVSAGYQTPGGGYQQVLPPPQGPYGAPCPPRPQGKSKIAAGLLGILVGGLGIHNFYLGRKGRAAGQLCLTCGGVLMLLLPVLIALLLVPAASSVPEDAGGWVWTLFSVFSAAMFLGPVMVAAAEIWGLVEGIVILCATPGVPPWGTDAEGVPLTG